MSSIYRVKYARTCQKELLSSLKELERELKQASLFGCLLKIFRAFSHRSLALQLLTRRICELRLFEREANLKSAK